VAGSVKPLFPPWSNTAFRVVLALAVLLPGAALSLGMIWVRSPLRTGKDEPVTQPVQFDHRHHVADLAIDCRYCHQTVETAASAGVPPAATCMSCHAQVWNKSELLEPVRESDFTELPIRWNRVHQLPDFVYFNHSIHVAKGVGCESCHGRVDEMSEVSQAATLTMKFCLDCHRNPKPNLRPRELVTAMGWEQPAGQERAAFGNKLAADYHVQTRTSCTTCHR
jgi:hypothetical protein